MAGLLSLVTIGSVLAGWLLTGMARRYALSRSILDRPNERSSHTAATPRGGGWGIVLPAQAAIVLAAALERLSWSTAIGLGGGALLVAIVGWLDDRYGLTAAVRGLVHLAAALWVVTWLGGYPTMDLGGKILTLGPWGNVLAVIAVVWAINLYNFMDGIDGLAALEAVMVGAVGGFLLLYDGASGLALVSFAVAGASAGFLGWNRPPARIFMGDVGSGLLGFLFAGLALAGERQAETPALLWVLLLGVFFADTTITLLRRVVRGERWYSAHRCHAYQRLVQAGWTHARVDLAICGINALLALLGLVAWALRTAMSVMFFAGGVILLSVYILVEYRQPLTPNRTSTP